MSLSIHDASVPVLTRGLTILSALLDKGEAHARETGVMPSSYVEARLAPDMLTLAGQVQRASDTAKFAAARLTGTEAPPFSDDEATFDQLRERCARTIAYLNSVPRAAFEGSETRDVSFGGGANRATLPGDRYLLQFALPNFFFHVTTAYDILRNKGVPLGKRDFLGPPRLTGAGECGSGPRPRARSDVGRAPGRGCSAQGHLRNSTVAHALLEGGLIRGCAGTPERVAPRRGRRPSGVSGAPLARYRGA